MASSPGANGTSSLPSRTTTYSPSDLLPIRRMLPRVPAGTAAEAARTTTRGLSPAWTRERSESMSASVSRGSAGLAFFRGGTAKDYDAPTAGAIAARDVSAAAQRHDNENDDDDEDDSPESDVHAVSSRRRRHGHRPALPWLYPTQPRRTRITRLSAFAKKQVPVTNYAICTGR